MDSKISRNLVIDACVASAAGGEDAKHPISRDCRDFLHAMQDLPHKIVRTEEIWLEWKKHKSVYARKWLGTMFAKKRVYEVKPEPNAELREFAGGLTDKQAAAMLKDCHLMEAAKTTDRVIISHETVARRLFSKASDSVEWVRTVAWVNPTEPKEAPIPWLQSGAAPTPDRCFPWHPR